VAAKDRNWHGKTMVIAKATYTSHFHRYLQLILWIVICPLPPSLIPLLPQENSLTVATIASGMEILYSPVQNGTQSAIKVLEVETLYALDSLFFAPL
jgi:hypothetical protein